MILKFIKSIVERLSKGKAYVVQKEDYIKYNQVSSALDNVAVRCFIHNAEPYELRLKDYPKNIIVPTIAVEFFQKGGKWDEITAYECVKKYGMLAGKRRRLVVV